MAFLISASAGLGDDLGTLPAWNIEDVVEGDHRIVGRASPDHLGRPRALRDASRAKKAVRSSVGLQETRITRETNLR